MEKLEVLKDVMTRYELSHEEAKQLVVWMVGEYKLSSFYVVDSKFFENLEELFALVRQYVVRTEEQKKLSEDKEKTAELQVEASISKEETVGHQEEKPKPSEKRPKPLKPRRLSKNGKPLGRPPRVKVPLSQEIFSQTKTEADAKDVAESKPVAADEHTSEEKAKSPSESSTAKESEYLDVGALLDASPPKNRPRDKKQLSNFFLRECDYPALKKLRIGPSRQLWVGYKVGDKYLISHYVLQDLTPVFVCVMYKTPIKGYVGVGIAIADDNSGTSIKDEAAYAKSLPEIDGEKWGIMNALQYALVRTVQIEFNVLCTKLGGDAMRGHYLAQSMDGTLPKGEGKIRLAIQLK